MWLLARSDMTARLMDSNLDNKVNIKTIPEGKLDGGVYFEKKSVTKTSISNKTELSILV